MDTIIHNRIRCKKCGEIWECEIRHGDAVEAMDNLIERILSEQE